MAAVHPYLNFNGNCGEAFEFYKSAFGVEPLSKMQFKDVPPEYAIGEGEGEKIMHIALPIGKGTILMGSDVPSEMGEVKNGTNAYVSISADSEEEATALFNALSADGNVIMPLDKAFWGAYFGMFADKFGTQWMINFDYNKAR